MKENKKKGIVPEAFFSGQELPLARAIYNDDINEVAAILNRKEIDINQPGEAGYTYLLYATSLGDRYKIMEFLLQNGADPNLISVVNTDSPESKRLPLLIVTYAKYDIKYMKLLIKYGADINDNRTDDVPLSGVMYGYGHQQEKFEYLIQIGADVNVKEKKVGMTPIIEAAGLEKFDYVEYLWDHGADPLVVCSNGISLQSRIQLYIDTVSEGTPEGRKRISRLIKRMEALGVRFDFSKTRLKLDR